MSDSRALIKHIEAVNAKSEAWVAEDPENRVGCSLVTIPDHWADYDIYTPEEFDRYLLEQDYSELYKQVHGVRPGRVLDITTTEHLIVAVDALYEQLEAEMEDQREYMDEMEADEDAWLAGIEAEFDEIEELQTSGSEWDDIAEDFDDVTKVKQIFH